MKRRGWSLALKAGVVFTMFAVISIISMVSVLYFQRGSNKIDGLRIDIAGRNRMLSQKAAFKLMIISKGGNVASEKEQLDEILALHHSSFLLLRNGGEAGGLEITGSYETFKEEFDQISETWKAYTVLIEKAINGQDLNTSELSEKAQELLVRNNLLVQAFVRDYNERNADYRLFFTILSSLTFVVFVIGILIIRNSFVKPTERVLSYIERLNAGHFDEKMSIDSRDELGRISSGLNDFAVKIHTLVDGLNQVSKKVLNSSEIVKTNADQSSENSSMQASSIEEISATLEELGAAAQMSAELSSSASTDSSAVLEQMNQIRGKGEEVARSLEEINTKIGIVEQISGQTNLLALNAAVEATQAGERGKGFAVIAKEIRKLADTSSAASDEIVRLIHTCNENAKATQELISVQEENLSRFMMDLRQVDKMSNEQQFSITEINKTIESLNRLSQTNAQMASELNTTSIELNTLTKGMNDEVSMIVA